MYGRLLSMSLRNSSQDFTECDARVAKTNHVSHEKRTKPSHTAPADDSADVRLTGCAPVARSRSGPVCAIRYSCGKVVASITVHVPVITLPLRAPENDCVLNADGFFGDGAFPLTGAPVTPQKQASEERAGSLTGFRFGADVPPGRLSTDPAD
jgi:hypothetical protein